MSDLFHEDVPDAFILDVLNVIRAAHARGHTFLVLTKRPERMRSIMSRLWFDNRGAGRMYLESRGDGSYSFAQVMKQLWLGVSVEDQATADARIPMLLQTPAAVRWVSAEPLLGPVDLSEWMEGYELGQQYLDAKARGDVVEALRLIRHGEPGIDWCVVGGESGPKARPCDVAWIRSVVEQCQEAGTPVFVKQLGADPRWQDVGFAPIQPARGKNADPDEWPTDLRVRQFPASPDREGR